LKSKTDWQLQALFQFHLRSRNERKRKVEVIDFADAIGLSFKEVSKWLWDREKAERRKQDILSRNVFAAGPVKLFRVIDKYGFETDASKNFAQERY